MAQFHSVFHSFFHRMPHTQVIRMLCVIAMLALLLLALSLQAPDSFLETLRTSSPPQGAAEWLQPRVSNNSSR